MRDPSRIDPLLQAIREAWMRHPDLRLGQIVQNAAYAGGWPQMDLFYCEDDVIARGMVLLDERSQPAAGEGEI